jgi:serine/threonine-protein kinase
VARLAQPAQSPLASVTVESRPSARIRINGEEVGTSPVRVQNLPPGLLQVEAFDPEQGFSRVEDVSLGPGDNGTRRIVLGKGVVEFRIRPYATVLVDGRLLGQTPLEPVELYEGSHTLKLLNRELGKEYTTELLVRAGRVHEVKHNLSR